MRLRRLRTVQGWKWVPSTKEKISYNENIISLHDKLDLVSTSCFISKIYQALNALGNSEIEYIGVEQLLSLHFTVTEALNQGMCHCKGSRR